MSGVIEEVTDWSKFKSYVSKYKDYVQLSKVFDSAGSPFTFKENFAALFLIFRP